MKRLVRLIYLSRVTPGVDLAAVRNILERAREHNARAQIGGLLCYTASHFLQVLEGPRGAVSARYHVIAADPRHADVQLIAFEEARERLFDTWSMGFLPLAGRAQRIVRKFTANGAIDIDNLWSGNALPLMVDLAAELHERLLSCSNERIETEVEDLRSALAA